MPPQRNNPPLSRHPALQPLSREHFNALVLVRRLRGAAGAGADARAHAGAQVRAAWEAELGPHFRDEERLLAHIVPESMARRLREEHGALHTAITRVTGTATPEGADLLALADLLGRHVRWEERELFPAAQRRATGEQLAFIAEHARLIEDKRPTSRRRQAGAAKRFPWDTSDKEPGA